jgi:hypothetical protein
MTTTPALWKILKGILHTEKEDKPGKYKKEKTPLDE